jgi:putative transposase
MLARHAGAARFAFNECLQMVKAALNDRNTNPDAQVPWTGFDLIKKFNGWKKTQAAGRVFIVDTAAAATMVSGLRWREQVCQQVFEEAAGCMTTPGGFGACSPSAEPRYCLPLLPTAAGGGGCH